MTDTIDHKIVMADAEDCSKEDLEMIERIDPVAKKLEDVLATAPDTEIALSALLTLVLTTADAIPSVIAPDYVKGLKNTVNLIESRLKHKALVDSLEQSKETSH